MKHFNLSLAGFLSVCVMGLFALPFGASAQFTQEFALQNSPEYEAEAKRLRGAPPREYDFSKALLSDVLRFLADDAGISFFGLPEGSDNSDRLVTFSLRTSPFTALETLAKANGIALIHDNGLWYLRPADDTQLIGRSYQINYNSQEQVTKGNSSSGTGISGGSSGGGQGGFGGSGGGLSLQGAPNTFEREPSKLIEDIKEILDLPSSNGFATLAPSASVDTFGQLSAANFRNQQNLVARVGQAGETGAAIDGEESDPVARVIWNSDANTLFVVATRQQHQWIEGYLASADQEQSLIAVEVKFFESNKDPSSELGLDWTGTLAGGYGANLNIPPSDIDLNRIQDYRLPTTSILSYDDVNVRLRALVDDRNTRIVSYPRMLTLDNREVVFRSVLNQPVLASSSATSVGAGATETTAVDYLPIGTVINILPKRMSNDNILLNISIEMSRIIGEEIINGNPFPIATSRVYGAPVQVESGYSVAISGLDEAEDQNIETGVPFLRRIPILGYAFKARGETRGRQHLMMFITPTILDPNGPGVSEVPVSHTANDPDIGPAVEEFEPTFMQYAESHRPVPPRSRRTDYPGASESGPEPAADSAPAPYFPMQEVTSPPTPDSDSDNNSTNYGERTLILAAPSRESFLEAPTAAKPTPAPFAEPFATKEAPTPTTIATAEPDTAKASPASTPIANVELEPSPLAATVARGPSSPSLSRSSRSQIVQWDGDKPAGGAASIGEAVNALRNEVNDLDMNVNLDEPSLRNESRIATVQKDSQRLIDYVESQKHKDPNAFEELNQSWWDLVKINGQSKDLRQSAIEASGVAAVDPALSTEE